MKTMNRLVYILISLFILSIGICINKNKQSDMLESEIVNASTIHHNTNLPDSIISAPNELAYWSSVASSLNYELVYITNNLYKFGFKDNGKGLHDLSYHLDWYNQCTPIFIQYFNSHYPNESISDKRKVTRVLNEIVELYHKEEEEGGTAGEIVSYNIKIPILRYKTISLYKECISSTKDKKVQNLLKDEMQCWITFVETYTDYLDNIICITHFGGSICTPDLLSMKHSLFIDRIDDQKLVINILRNNHQPCKTVTTSMSKELEAFNNELKKARDRNYDPDFIADAFQHSKDCSYMMSLYDSTYIEAKQNSKVVKRQISKWYAARQDIKTTLKNDSIQANAYENATINYIHELTQHIKSIAPVSAGTE